MSDLRNEEITELLFAPNIARVMKSSKYNRLYLMGSISALSVVFSPLVIYTKIIILVLASILGFLKALSLIYNNNILVNPISINPENNELSYFDEFSIKRKSLSLNSVESLRVFNKNNYPYILEFNLSEEKKGKKIEENINVEAFDNGSIIYLLKTIKEINPGIEIIVKNIEKKQ